MIFDNADADTCQHSLAIDVAHEFRSLTKELYRQQWDRNREIGGDMANAVLAGLTVVWLEAVHGCWDTIESESAMSLLQGLSPDSTATKKEMRRAARDFLRRSGWWIKGTK